MSTLNTPNATPSATHFCMSALPTGSSVEGRLMVADIAYFRGVRVPAFLKDAQGVRAWSPPV